MSDGQVKNTVQGYISLNVQRYFATEQVKIQVYLYGRQVNILRFFLSLMWLYCHLVTSQVLIESVPLIVWESFFRILNFTNNTYTLE